MPLRALACAILFTAACAPAGAAPYLPASDEQVLERLPFPPNDPVVRELRALSAQLAQHADDLPLAVRVAQGYLELGRVTGDPRYVGYAQAALAPWWHLQRAPQEVLVLRATLHQRVHEFDAALADLATVLADNPRNLQARLTRATVMQVQGAYDSAREDCSALQNLARELIWTGCLCSVDAVNGRLRESYSQLRAALAKAPNTSTAIQGWVLTSLAEMAARAGMAAEAEMHFRAALVLDPADSYLLGAYADFLLDNDRPDEVAALLRDKTRADPLLLRYALALQAENSTELAGRLEQLRDRFAASRMRGDRIHLREEARFTLHLLHAPQAALTLAQDNWVVQKEPADLRILLEAALAARDAAAIDRATEWLRDSRLQDVHLTWLIADEKFQN